MTIAMACFYGLVMLALGILFLVEWIRNYRQIRRYWKYGLMVGAILVGLNVAVIALTPAVRGGYFMALYAGISVVLFARAVGFTMLGIFYSARLGYPSFALARESLARDADTEAETADASVAIGEDALSPAADWEREESYPTPPQDGETPMPMDEQSVATDVVVTPPIPGFDGQHCLLDVTLVAAGSVLYSIVLFMLTSPQISETAKKAFGLSGDGQTMPETLTPQLILSLLAFAFGEEVFFRLGIQNFLARHLHWEGRKYWLAILLTTVVWTLGHAGALDPTWVKLAQVFPMGILLGWLFKRHGVESAIAAHAIFNLAFTVFWLSYLQ